MQLKDDLQEEQSKLVVDEAVTDDSERTTETSKETTVPANTIDPAKRDEELRIKQRAAWQLAWRNGSEMTKQEIRNHKVPIIVIAAMILCPPLLLIWIPLVLGWAIAEVIYPKLPLAYKKRADALIPEQWKSSELFRELSVGVAQVRPFMLAGVYLGCIPIALLWMAGHWAKSLFHKGEDEVKETAFNPDTITIVQNRRSIKEECDSNFFHSHAFSLTCLTIFGCGLPAALTYILYQKLGIDAILGFPSADPRFTTIFVIIGLYIYSLASCLSVLFIRAWFTFPLNFTGDESRLELNEQRLQRRVDSWFTQVVTYNKPWGGRDSLDWSEVKYVGYQAPNAIKLYPLPTTAFSENSLIYKGLNKLAQLVDSISQRAGGQEIITLTTSSTKSGFGSVMKINLGDMDGDDRARLFYAIRNWAPHVDIDERVQEKMLGSSVMQAPRYTQMWFELLTDQMSRKRLGSLPPDEKLRNGELTITQRLSSGGQANIYLATQSDGTEVVLKEFILSSADALGALVESAGEFETESSLLSELRHDRIVKMLDFFAEDRRLYIILERVKGASLREFVKANGPVSEQLTIKLALQIAEVLEYLHGQTPALIHRDLTPDNIMFDEKSEIKVIDFSLAAGKKSRRTTSTMGKHSYAPPEQLRENPCPQSDIYAFGATLYFLLTGMDPKPITTSDAKLKRDDIDERLNEIIKRSTALDLEERYSDIKWMKLDLEALCRTETKAVSKL